MSDFFLWFRVFFWEYLALAALLSLIFLALGAGWKVSVPGGLVLGTLLPLSVFVGLRILGV
ncbi:hypothetical protein [Streptomyces collinus]|uniref:hypothetical protein n=1 Tax=Streptomyces collinus TaxID=42684 RepID=UPI0036A844EF